MGSKAMNSRVLMNRFLKSRVLPILTILILFAGWVVAAGFLLWQIKVKEVFPCVGSVVFSSHAGKEEVALVLQGDFHGERLFPLDSDQEIELALTDPHGRRETLRAILIRSETGDTAKRLILSLDDEDMKKARIWTHLTDRSEPLKMNLAVRHKRLLSVALKKNQLFQ